MDVKTSTGVYFYVGRTSNYNSSYSVIPYEVEHLNVGNAMNLASGAFTAPVNGRYQFNFVALGDYSSESTGKIDAQLLLNGAQIAYGYSPRQNENLAFTATASLKKGDKIESYLAAGSIKEGGDTYYTQFVGILLEEDLVLS